MNPSCWNGQSLKSGIFQALQNFEVQKIFRSFLICASEPKEIEIMNIVCDAYIYCLIYRHLFFMKKSFLALMCFAALNASCKKCLHCVHTYKDGNGVTHTVDLGKRCGEEQDIKALEDSCSEMAQSLGGNCTCTDN